VSETPQSVVIALEGDLDIASRGHVRALLEAVSTRPVAIVDLTNVDFIGSTGVTELLYAFQKRRERGLEAMRLVVAPGATVNRVIEIAGLDKVFGIYHTIADAQDA